MAEDMAMNDRRDDAPRPPLDANEGLARSTWRRIAWFAFALLGVALVV